VVQRQVLYLGEINDSQKAAWCQSIAVLEASSGQWRQVALFPEDREAPELAQEVVHIRLDDASAATPAMGWLLVEFWAVATVAAG